MPTRILDLYLQDIAISTGTNEDWLDGWGYYDDNGAPIPLAGIEFSGMLRPVAESERVDLILATDGVPVVAGRVRAPLVVGGASGNVLSINAPAAIIGRVQPGDYVFDILAAADGYVRRTATGTVSLVQGVTR